MECPYCNCEETKVIDSRESKDKASIKRRRECIKCSKRFTTIEKVLKLDLEVKKSNGEVEVFNLQKIKNSLLKACEKRPITLEQINLIIDKVLVDLKKVEEHIIPTSTVGSFVLKNLKQIDEIAFLKYAIVYNNYESMEEFMKEIGKLNDFDEFNYDNYNKFKKPMTNKEVI